MKKINYRQVHLDFHTSQYITEIGKDFNAEEFAETLESAHVNSITCFARCHHGWLYYPSKKNPELHHPNLKNPNLLLEQIEACHTRGIRVPVYTTVRWDERVIREHPEWLCQDITGDFISPEKLPKPHFCYDICLNSGYREFFKEHIKDIIHVVKAENLDGIFMDIVMQTECCCDNCKRLMKEDGLDPLLKKDRIYFAELTLNRFRSEISALIREYAPDATIYYNDPSVDQVLKNALDAYSHLELESLPSGDWGYDHFPAMARYENHFGKQMIGMTGKFHTAWGDFHSLKNKAALEFECFQMLAMGAGCSIGDQLHPFGRLSKATYDLIGEVYSSVEKKEPYCRDTCPKAEIAVLTPHEYLNPLLDGRGLPKALTGAVHILQELSYQFTIVDSQESFDSYKILILPDEIPYSEILERKLDKYIKKGGAVFGSYHACINGHESKLYGINHVHESEYSKEFVLPNSVIGSSLPEEPFVMYERGLDFDSVSAETIMEKTQPWFDRGSSAQSAASTVFHPKSNAVSENMFFKGEEQFCSHLHTPSPNTHRKAEVVQKGQSIYCGHPVFTIYRQNAPRWCKEMVKDILKQLCKNQLISHDGPSTVQCFLNTKDSKTHILHVLHYIPEKKSEEIYTIEDVIPLYHLNFQLLMEKSPIKSIVLVPGNIDVPFQKENEFAQFTVDKITGHQMIQIIYE
jgi:hypothetical protein